MFNENFGVKILEKQGNWESFKNELDILKMLKVMHNSNIVNIIDCYENSAYHFLILEYFESESLSSFFKKKEYKLNVLEVASILFQIAKALKLLHSFGLVYRNLNIDNVLIEETKKDGGERFQVKLFDFTTAFFNFEREGKNKGKLLIEFIAPEIINRKDYNYSVDLWSLGVIGYYLIAGEFPFKKVSKYKYDTSSMDYFFSSKFLKKTGEAIDLIQSCFQEDPGLRINIDDFIKHPWFERI